MIGSREKYTILDGERETPVYKIDGPEDGPSAVVVCGIHGNEVTSYEAGDLIRCWGIARGTVVVIPRAVRRACENGTRQAPGEPDMNRQFPSGQEPSHEVSRAIWDEITSHDPDYVFDLHRSKGLYRRSPSGVGMCVFPTPSAREAAEDSLQHLNEGHVPDGKAEFRVGNDQSGYNDLLSHKVGGDLDPDTVGWLIETTYHEQDSYTQRDQLEHAVEALLYHSESSNDERIRVEDYGHDEQVPRDEVLEEYEPDEPEEPTSPDPEEPVDDPDGEVSFDWSEWGLVDVTQHGFDGTASQGLASFIADYDEEDCLFILPEGEYLWDREIWYTGGTGEYSEPMPERYGLIGRPDATVRVDMRPNCTDEPNILRFGDKDNGIQNVILKNIHFDIGDADPERDAGIMRAYVAGQMYTENLSLSKRHRIGPEGEDNGDRHTFLTCCVEEDAVAVHRDIDLTAGDKYRPGEESVGHAIGFAGEPPHVGTTYWTRCRIAGYTDNGFYVRDGVGANILDGCLARNCGGGHIRLGLNDRARDCEVIVDGTEEPANGTAVWLQDASGTVAEGIRIIAPAMGNDVFRTTGYQENGRISDCYVELGDTGQYVWKARSDGPGSFQFEGVSVYDDCDGYTRESSYSIDQPNVTIRNLTHHGTGGRIPFTPRSEGLAVRDSRIEVDGMLLARLGSILEEGETVDVLFDHVTVVDESGYDALFSTYQSPEQVRLAMRDCTLDETDYSTVIQDAELSDYQVGYERDTIWPE